MHLLVHFGIYELTSDVLKVLKTSRVTINPEMDEQVHTIFYLEYIFNKINPTLFFELNVLCTLYFLGLLFFHGRPCLPNIQPGL